MRERQARLLRPPLRLRITIAASASMTVILVILSMFVYIRLHAELIRALDSGLQARASAIAAGLGQAGNAGHAANATSLSQAISDGPDVRLATTTQIVTPGGQILARSGTPIHVLSARLLRNLRGPAFVQVPSHGLGAPLRLCLLPINEGQPLVIVTGTSPIDVEQTMGTLRLLLVVGDPAALALASLVAWLMTGAALRPVERMRREAAVISVSEPARRLPVPKTNDEVARLGDTLNSLLDRLQGAIERERRLLDDASHELRTPLSTLKAEVDLALSRDRSAAELQATLHSVSEEANRLTRLAQDMLVLSRARDGGLAIHRTSTALRELLERACARHRPRASASGRLIDCDAPAAEVWVDPMRLTQAIDNLLDNAIRYSGRDGLIHVRAGVTETVARITISNTGPGFPDHVLPRAFEPFVSAAHADPQVRDQPGSGLGLAIVQAVARAHEGSAMATNVPGGASVTMTLMLKPPARHSPADAVTARR